MKGQYNKNKLSMSFKLNNITYEKCMNDSA